MKVTLNWGKIEELGSPENYKSWCNSKKISYNEILTTVEESPSLKGPPYNTLQVRVKDSIYSFYAYSLMPVVEAKPLEDWM